MDFELSEEQELLRAGLRELLGRVCDPRRVRTIAYEGDGRAPEVWEALAGAGWTRVVTPEADGGAGLRFEEAMIVMEDAGRAALPVPLTMTLLASLTIGRAGEWPNRSQMLSRIASGQASVTLALRAAAFGVGEAPALCEAAQEGDGWRLSGGHVYVPFGPLADVALVEAALPRGGSGLFVVPTDAPGVAWTDLDAMDRTVRQFELTLDGVKLEAEAALFGARDASAEIERLADEWRAALCAETLGACQQMLEMSVAYAKERVQFGRPIGANQAVKGRLAEMGAAVERMRAAVYHAAVKVDADAEDRALAVAMAKVATAAPGAWVGSQAIHVHGGIGYTWEHDLHLYFKRAKSNELLLGDGMTHLARVADAVL